MHETNERRTEVVFVSALPARDQIGDRETIPHWTNASRLALGMGTLAMPMYALAIALASLVSIEPSPLLLALTVGLLVLHMMFALLYVAFAGQNPRLYSPFSWQMAIVFAGPVAMPAYWVIHVWHAPRTRGAAPRYRDSLEARSHVGMRGAPLGPLTLPIVPL